ncbi:MAG: amidohydrolase family protein, partial [Clostridia bacterium]|nr:amidohydrolase family protein [Clostridia bacterium]
MTETFNARHGYRDMALCDSHIHISNLMPIGDTEHVLAVCARFFDLDRLAILALPHSSVSYCDDPSNNVKTLYLKARLGTRLGAGRVYAFGGLYHHFDARDTARGFEDQLLRVMDMGFDGLKTLMGKPPLRKRLGMPLSAPVFDGIWRRCEQKGFPVTMHLGDPGHWWRPGRDGKPAAYDETYLTLGRQREEVEEILERFPGLNLLLCHFYFIADDLEGARAFMERHQNALLDITPGGEMYYHFSQRADEWRDFFRQYQKRILFGSDTDNWAVPDTPDGYD